MIELYHVVAGPTVANLLHKLKNVSARTLVRMMLLILIIPEIFRADVR